VGATYNLIREYAEFEGARDLSTSPHWVMAIVRLGKPLSYSRNKAASVSLDITEGAKTRGSTLIITNDCIQMQVSRSKESHVKSLSASLVQSHTNYLVEVLPGDWIMAWIVHGQEKQTDLAKRIADGKACNGFDDGLKFVGRVRSIRKRMSRDKNSGTKSTRYQIMASAFAELDTTIFYDQHMADNSIASADLGRWLSRVGLDIRELFASEADEQKDNVHLLIPAFVELLLGTGVGDSLDATGTKELRQGTGGGLYEDTDGKTKSAPFGYLVPKEIGDLLGKTSRDPQKASGILAYADIMDMVFGVQTYSNTNENQYGVFIPELKDGKPTKGNHYYTGSPLMGAFLPFMPSFDNRPLWSVLSEYLNPLINEMYTCLRVNAAGNVAPTLVLRQIPFTSVVLANKFVGPSYRDVTLTTYDSLPRWVIPAAIVNDIDIGRSDATRVNFVHVYGQDSDNAKNIPITDQIVQNPPIRDDFDIQRSGLHSFMSTIACRVINEVGTTPKVWMEIIADHRIGSQYTLNGTIHCIGIQSPICEGDNIQFDGVVYHIESVDDVVSMDSGGGHRNWSTSLTLTNGLRADDVIGDTNEEYPIYPGFRKDDNTALDPGHGGSAFALKKGAADTDGLENEAVDNERVKSPFNPADDTSKPFSLDDIAGDTEPLDIDEMVGKKDNKKGKKLKKRSKK
jgi:hypothetical protein